MQNSVIGPLPLQPAFKAERARRIGQSYGQWRAAHQGCGYFRETSWPCNKDRRALVDKAVDLEKVLDLHLRSPDLVRLDQKISIVLSLEAFDLLFRLDRGAEAMIVSVNRRSNDGVRIPLPSVPRPVLAAEPASFLAILLAKGTPSLASGFFAPMRDDARRDARRFIGWGGFVGHFAPPFATAASERDRRKIRRSTSAVKPRQVATATRGVTTQMFG